MNNRQRDAAAEAFRKIATELEGTKAHAEAKAAATADASGITGAARQQFVERFVEAWCIDQLTRAAATIRSAIDVYLTAPAAHPPRGRR